ncbi:hypothetical protein [Paractinoplanes lichenicola]|uniref:hypothetical protein n=1 Tax=Paractinoplanes lichenicola TaxID=2802976 RepID=UPI001F41FB29|nr:hypothetical protein [Actinoplanes lichenicola]
MLAAASVATVAAAVLAFGLGHDLAAEGRPEAGDLLAPTPSSGAPSPATPTRPATPDGSPTTDRPATANPAGAGVTAESLPSAKARLCANADIEVSISAQNENPTAIGTQRGLISVANQSGTPCRVDGRAFVATTTVDGVLVECPGRLSRPSCRADKRGDLPVQFDSWLRKESMSHTLDIWTNLPSRTL